MKKSILLLAFLTAFFHAFSQQDAIYYQYMYNGLVINPAYAGTEDAIGMVLLQKKQWLGFRAAPAGQSFSVNSPLGYSGIKHKIGVGLSMENYKFGPNANTAFYGNASYKIPAGPGKLSFGLKGGLLWYRVNWDRIEYYSGYQAGDKNKWSVMLPTLGLGMMYYTDVYYAGITIENLNQPGLELTKLRNGRSGSLYRNFLITSGYRIRINGNMAIKPSFLFKYVQNSPVDFNVNANFIFRDKFWFGTGIRYKAGAGFMAGVNITDDLKIGYSYESTLNRLKPYLAGSHEIALIWDLKRKKPKITLNYITQDGVILKTAELDGEGYFHFDNLPLDTNYLFKLECADSRLIKLMKEVQVVYKDKTGKDVVISVKGDNDRFFRYAYLPVKEEKLFAVNQDHDTLEAAVKNKEGHFVFQRLPNNQTIRFLPGFVAEVNDSMLIVVNGKNKKIVNGKEQYFIYEYLPFGVAKLHLISEKGDTLSTGYMNSDGFFEFTKLLPAENYLFALEADDAGLIDEVQILYKDKSGKSIILTIEKESGKFFKYISLNQKEERLFLIGKNGDTITSAIRNAEGFFVFEKLPSNQNYTFRLDEKDVALMDDILIILKDEKGKETLITAEKDKENLFKYSHLPQSEVNISGIIGENQVLVILNPKQEAIVKTAYESLKFNTGEAIIRLDSYPHLEELSQLLNENADWIIKLSGFTDNIGTDNFNLMLSKRRAETVKRSLVKRNVAAERIAVKYFGKANPVASNSDEEGRQKNRRVEMVIVKEKRK